MLVFIDESGDPGFKVAKGSSPVFVAAMVVFASNEEANRAQGAVRELLKKSIIALNSSSISVEMTSVMPSSLR